MKEHAIKFAKYIKENYRFRKSKYRHVGDFYKNGLFLTEEQIYNKFIQENDTK